MRLVYDSFLARVFYWKSPVKSEIYLRFGAWVSVRKKPLYRVEHGRVKRSSRFIFCISYSFIKIEADIYLRCIKLYPVYSYELKIILSKEYFFITCVRLPSDEHLKLIIHML